MTAELLQTLTPFPVTAIAEHRAHAIPGMALLPRVPCPLSTPAASMRALVLATVQSNHLMSVFEPNYMEVFIQ